MLNPWRTATPRAHAAEHLCYCTWPSVQSHFVREPRGPRTQCMPAAHPCCRVVVDSQNILLQSARRSECLCPPDTRDTVQVPPSQQTHCVCAASSPLAQSSESAYTVTTQCRLTATGCLQNSTWRVFTRSTRKLLAHLSITCNKHMITMTNVSGAPQAPGTLMDAARAQLGGHRIPHSSAQPRHRRGR